MTATPPTASLRTAPLPATRAAAAPVPTATRATAGRRAAVPLPAGRILGVASGKGGVGKTWLAITLSHALARAGERVLLFDGDLGLANVDIQLGLTPDLDLASVVEGRVTIADAALAHPDGFAILAGRSGSGALAQLDPAALEHLLAALRVAAGGFDRVVLDLGAGLGRAVRRMAGFADTLLVVASEEPTSLTDAYAALKLHAVDAPGSDARVVVNQATSRASGERTYTTLARACDAFLGWTPPLAGIIRRDDRVRDAIRRQTPFLTRHPTAPAAADVEAVAASLRAG
jgi:flagellar biosynthesis protein FlhG